MIKNMHPDGRLSALMEELCEKTEQQKGNGLVSYLGVYQSGGRQANWIRNAVPTEDLLSLIESGVASKVLACIGNTNRLKSCWRSCAAPQRWQNWLRSAGW